MKSKLKHTAITCLCHILQKSAKRAQNETQLTISNSVLLDSDFNQQEDPESGELNQTLHKSTLRFENFRSVKSYLQ